MSFWGSRKEKPRSSSTLGGVHERTVQMKYSVSDTLLATESGALPAKNGTEASTLHTGAPVDTVKWTVFPPRRPDQEHVAHGGQDRKGSFASLAQWIKDEHEDHYFTKGCGSSWSPVSNRDGHRCNASTEAVYCLVLDCDGAGQWDTALKALDGLGMAYVAHQSSGYTVDNPKWRLILPLSEAFRIGGEAKQNTLWNQFYEFIRVKIGHLAGFSNPNGSGKTDGFDPAPRASSNAFYLGHRSGPSDRLREVRVGAGTKSLSLPSEWTEFKATAKIKASKKFSAENPGNPAKFPQQSLPGDTIIELTRAGSVTESPPFSSVSVSSHCRCPSHGGSGGGSAYTFIKGDGTPAIHCSSCQVTWHVASACSANNEFVRAIPPNVYVANGIARTPVLITVNQQYLSDGLVKLMADHGCLPTSDGITYINGIAVKQTRCEDVVYLADSGCGTGKTVFAESMMRLADKMYPDMGQVATNHRVALAKETAVRMGLEVYTDSCVGRKVSVTLDSLPKVPTFDIDEDGDVVGREFSCLLMDEVDQQIRHTIGGTIGDNSSKVLSHLQVIGKNSKMILVMSADISQTTMDQVQALFPGRRLVVIKNTWSPTIRSVQQNEGRAETTVAFRAAVKSGRSVVYYSGGSEEHTTVIAGMAAAESPDAKIVLINSRTSQYVETQRMMENGLNKTLVEFKKEHGQVVMIAAMTVGSGVNIDSPIFDKAFIDSPSHEIPASDIFQLANRVRHLTDNEIVAWIDPRQSFRETDPKKIRDRMLNVATYTEDIANKVYASVPMMNLATPTTMAPANPMALDIFVDAMATKNLSTNNLRKSFSEHAKNRGWGMKDPVSVADQTPQYVAEVEAVKNEIKDLRVKNRQIKAQRTLSSKEITYEEAAKISRARTKTQAEMESERLAMAKHFYGPGVTLTEELLIEDAKQGTRGKIKRFAELMLMADGIHGVQAASTRALKEMSVGLTHRIKGYNRHEVFLLTRILPLYGVVGKWYEFQDRLTIASDMDSRVRPLLAEIKSSWGVSLNNKVIQGVDYGPDYFGMLGRILANYGVKLKDKRARAKDGSFYSIHYTNRDIMKTMIELSAASKNRIVELWGKIQADRALMSPTQQREQDQAIEEYFAEHEEDLGFFGPSVN